MKRERIGVGSLLTVLALGVAGLWWLNSTPPDVPVASEPREGAASATDRVSQELRADAAEPTQRELAAPERAPVAAPATAWPEIDPTQACLRGRCVDAHGAPLVDCSVTITGVSPLGSQAKSAADGSFTLAFTPAKGFEVRLVARHRQHLDAIRAWPAVSPGMRLELGDMPLGAGAVVSGRIRDAAGQNVGNLALRAVPSGSGWTSEPRQASATTDANGTFTLDAALAPGRWVLRADPHVFATTAVITASPAQPQHLDLQLAPRREPQRIAGRVVDASDQPVAGVEVRVVDPSHVQPVTTRADGTFELLGWDEGGEAAAVVLTPSDGGAADAPTTIAWGTRDARLVWRRGTTLRARLRGGKPEEWARCKLVATIAGGAPTLDPKTLKVPPRREARADFDQRGEAVLTSLPAGRCVAAVLAPKLVAKPQFIELGGRREHEIEFLLSDRVSRTLQVRLADGRPARAGRTPWACICWPPMSSARANARSVRSRPSPRPTAASTASPHPAATTRRSRIRSPVTAC